jgi:hypothetical protein
MPYKDKTRAREYQREWARKQRDNASSANFLEPSQDFTFESANDLAPVLEAVINEVLDAKMEAATRGRCIAQLVQTSIKLLELGDLDARLSALEARLGV